jgi:hypothetical protein
MKSILALLSHSIDYAGLFPPAGLDMKSAVGNYATYLEAADVWMLGRFIVPVLRLDEFESVAVELFPRDVNPRVWHLSVLSDADLGDGVKKIADFNKRYGAAPDSGRAIIDTIEVKVSTADEIQAALDVTPKAFDVYCEIPIKDEPNQLIAAIQKVGARAKVRTGGITHDAFPTTADLARFIARCVNAGVAFKATAGLHHPIRSTYKLTYEKNSPTGMMFGFLNLLLASAFIYDGMNADHAVQLLEEQSRENFRFDDEGMMWRGKKLTSEKIMQARQRVIASFGSCSFQEPVQDLKLMGLL